MRKTLAEANPELAKEWHFTKNGELTPDSVGEFSNRKIWWRCKEGHEWQSPVSVRSKGCGCPYCAGKYPIVGKTDLVTVNPQLAAEWHPDKNGELIPTEVTANSNKKVWWLCKKGHEWKISVNHRNRGRGCPYCAGKIAMKGETDLATVNPKLAVEWHPTKNEGLEAKDVTVGSNKKIWWCCKNGHEWKAQVKSRSEGKGCPYCVGKIPVKGENDLATVNPMLTKEWHPHNNGDLKPTDVTANSNKKVWWQCLNGHEWQAMINSRNHGNGCPFCAGRIAVKGVNDLATVNPTLAAEWHSYKNGDLKPTDVTVKSNKKVRWLCPRGHEWKAPVYSRTQGKGCPFCSGRYDIRKKQYGQKNKRYLIRVKS